MVDGARTQLFIYFSYYMYVYLPHLLAAQQGSGSPGKPPSAWWPFLTLKMMVIMDAHLIEGNVLASLFGKIHCLDRQ
jgi:hypothetical protein